MTISDLAFAALALLTLGYVPLALKMVAAARIKPRIWALTLFSILIATLALYVLAYVLAVADSMAGYPVPKDTVIGLLRLLLLPLAGFPYLYVWVRQTGRFRDGSS